MTQKLEALHLEALCEEVRGEGVVPADSRGAVTTVLWSSRGGSSQCLSVCLQDLQQRIQKHSEVETVDLVLKLKDKLVSTNSTHC